MASWAPQLLLLSQLLPFLLLSLLLHLPFNVGGGRHEEGSNVKVRGLAVCDSCQQNRPSFFSLPIYGATVKLTCKKKAKKHTKSSIFFVAKSKSDKHGAFAFKLPFSKPSNLRRCNVELTSSPFEGCNQHTRYSSRLLSPILPFHPKEKNQLTYSAGWLTLQSPSLPSFCNMSKSFPSKDYYSKDASIVPQGFSLPWLSPFPGSPTPSFPFNFFPPSFPVPNLPRTTTPTNPFPFPSVPGLPPFSLPNSPELPPFQSFPFPFPFPTPSLPFSSSNYPPLEFPPLPWNPFAPPTIPQNPLTPTPFSNLPPIQPPSFFAPPELRIPPLPPNPLSPNTPP